MTETRTKEKAEKIRKEFEIKLSKMSAERDRLQKASKEHTKLIKSKSQHEKQMKTLQSDLADMKKLKVCVCIGDGGVCNMVVEEGLPEESNQRAHKTGAKKVTE